MTRAPKQKLIFERQVGGDECELTVVCEPEAPGGPMVCQPAAVPAFATNDDLPEDIRAALPAPLQTIYREAYNQAWAQYVMPIKRGPMPRHDKVARKAAWAEVHRQYSQHGSTWVRRGATQS